jgi:hypothetical protein
MKISEYDVDLSAYLALNGLYSEEANEGVREDIASKMAVHARKIKETNPNFVLRV